MATNGVAIFSTISSLCNTKIAKKMKKKVPAKLSASESSENQTDEFNYESDEYLLSEEEYEKYVIRIRNMSRGFH
jgi:hypothetical protein